MGTGKEEVDFMYAIGLVRGYLAHPRIQQYLSELGVGDVEIAELCAIISDIYLASLGKDACG